MQWLSDLFNAILVWLVGVIKAVFGAIFDFFIDTAIAVLDLILTALAALITSIPAPEFLAGGSGSFLNGLPSSVIYFLGMSGFAAGLGLLGAGFAFRMVRKLVTLGQW